MNILSILKRRRPYKKEKWLNSTKNKFIVTQSQLIYEDIINDYL